MPTGPEFDRGFTWAMVLNLPLAIIIIALGNWIAAQLIPF